MEDYKRIIIFYPITDKLAAGITFANLFKGWPADKLAIIADETSLEFVGGQFGKDVQCIPLYSEKLIPFESNRSNSFKASLRRWLSSWFGLSDIRGRVDVPLKVVSFIDDFKPDVLFTPLGNLTTINFFNNLLKIRDIPVAIHIMDDWPGTAYNNRLFKTYWKTKYDNEVKSFFQRAQFHLSICDAMSREYSKRYSREFYSFFNPVEPKDWMGKKERQFAEDDCIRIVFAGKINTDTYQPLLDMCKSVEIAVNHLKRNISFDIYSPTNHEKFKEVTKNYSHCHMRGFVSHDRIPDVLMNHDILFLPFSFSEHTKKYLKYSMSTNTAEYLISQTPILFYGPDVLAQYDFYSKRESAFLVTQEGVEHLEKKLEYIVNSPDQVNTVVNAALRVVEKECSVDVVCPKFKSVFNK